MYVHCKYVSALWVYNILQKGLHHPVSQQISVDGALQDGISSYASY